MEKIVEKQVNEHAADKDAEFKAKKAAAAKAWKERKEKEASDRQEGAKKLIEYLNSKKVELPEEFKTLLNDIANPKKPAHSSGSGLFNKIFGDNPKVGDKVTLMEVFQKTFKSRGEIDRAVKTWAEKGIVVEFKESAGNMINSTYTIVKLA